MKLPKGVILIETWNEGAQRVYQLPKRITKDSRGRDICVCTHERLKPEYSWDDQTDSINMVCVSDAHSHDERLVFPAVFVLEKATGRRFVTRESMHIAGQMTFLIHGGDRGSMRPDAVYIRQLLIANAHNSARDAQGVTK